MHGCLVLIVIWLYSIWSVASIYNETNIIYTPWSFHWYIIPMCVNIIGALTDDACEYFRYINRCHRCALQIATLQRFFSPSHWISGPDPPVLQESLLCGNYASELYCVMVLVSHMTEMKSFSHEFHFKTCIGLHIDTKYPHLIF